MSPALPQELLDHIVDNVHAEVHSPTSPEPPWADILALLGTSRCFGARCRKHLYRSVCIDLEITPPIHIDKTLDAASLQFMELVCHRPSLGAYVKKVSYGLYFELHEPTHITSTTAWKMLRELAPYLTRLDSVAVDCYDSRVNPHGIRMSLDSKLVKAIGQVIPSCPFHKLSLWQMDLLPFHLVDLLSYCPHITSLDIEQVSVSYDPLGDRGIVRPVVASKLEELMLAEADYFLCRMMSDEACRRLCASVRRFVLPAWDMTDYVWGPLGEFIPQLKALETVFVNLFDDDLEFDVRAFLHAPSLCLELYDTPNTLTVMSSALKQNPNYPSRLRRVAIIVHPSRGQSIDEWQKLASALHQPRFAALETVCITFSGILLAETSYTLEDVSRCFAGLTAKVHVRVLALDPAVYSYFDTLF